MKLRTALQLIRYLGPRWVCFRLVYSLRKRTGFLERRSPREPWAAFPAPKLAPVFPAPAPLQPTARQWGDRSLSEADAIMRGEFSLFFHHKKKLGFPPDWHRNSFTGEIAPQTQHWSELDDFGFGDIKAIWEPSRFGWAFTLARAFARTRDARYAETFWRLFEDWCDKNPPNTGVNWKCGQEATFRLMAAAFALSVFGDVATSSRRLEMWSRFVTATGRRIAANLGYALSQSNNHGVSECIGLLTAAAYLDSVEESTRWHQRGLRELHKQLATLVYADGAFSQHSMVYHRVLLEDLFWVIRLFRATSQAVPTWLEGKVRSALAFFTALVDENTGGAPLYGANDGSRVLPLDDCAYDDFRGTVQAGHVLLNNSRVLPPGPWDEAAFWLTGRDPADIPLHAIERPAHWHAPEGGCFQWCAGDMKLFLRCPTRFRHRPGHADMLHASVWLKESAIAHDTGTYSYNTPSPFAGALKEAAWHNVPMLAGREPMHKVGRFLYVPWPKGSAEWKKDDARFCATHDAYGHAATLQRSIMSPLPGAFKVTDTMAIAQPGRVRIHWLLADADWKLDLTTCSVSASIDGGIFVVSWECALRASSASLMRADPHSARGWWSRHYLAVEPAVSLELLFDVKDSIEVSTTFAGKA